MILLHSAMALLVCALMRLSCRSVDVLQIWFQLQRLMDLRHLVAAWASSDVTEGVRVVHETV